MRSNHAISFALSALLLTSATPIEPPQARRSPHTASPVRCSLAPVVGEHGRGYGGVQPRVLQMPAMPAIAPPPPSPAPPPPASEMSLDVADSVIVTSQRVAPGFVAAPGYARSPENRERYAGEAVAAVQAVADAPVSTFSVDVDTGSYSNVRRFLTQGRLPPQAAVRTEEMLNYFRYDYPRPANRDAPFSISTDMSMTPWNESTRLLRVGLRGYDLEREARPRANLVFLIDVSGSMMDEDKPRPR